MENITYLRNENLKTVKPGYSGNKVINGQFANGEELYQPSFWNVLKWKFSKNPQAEEKKNDKFRVEIKPLDPAIFSAKNDTIIWLGHASFFVRLNGVSILIDPVLYDLPLLPRKSPLPCDPEKIKNVDFLLLSHGHRDHLDKRSIKTIFRNNSQLKSFVPLKMAALLGKFAPDMPVEEAGWFQQFSPERTQGIEIFYLPARHWFRRGLTDTNKILWGGFLLRANGKSLYFSGDTASGPHFREIRELFGSPDHCLMPIGAYKPPVIMHKSHVNPQESVAAFHELDGKNFIPMHYGCFDLSDEPPGEPLRMVREMAYANQLDGKLIVPAIGEEIPI